MALAFWNVEGVWLLPLIALAGISGRLAWAMIPALLKVSFNTNEILVSLMLVYVAELFRSAMLASARVRPPDPLPHPPRRAGRGLGETADETLLGVNFYV